MTVSELSIAFIDVTVDGVVVERTRGAALEVAGALQSLCWGSQVVPPPRIPGVDTCCPGVDTCCHRTPDYQCFLVQVRIHVIPVTQVLIHVVTVSQVLIRVIMVSQVLIHVIPVCQVLVRVV